MSKKNGTDEQPQAPAPVNLDEQMKAIEGQIAELRGIHSYLNSLKEGGFDLIPPAKDGEEAQAQG
jgi:hypothetical protein